MLLPVQVEHDEHAAALAGRRNRLVIGPAGIGVAYGMVEIAALTLAGLLGDYAYQAAVYGSPLPESRPVEVGSLVALGLTLAGLHVLLLRPHGHYGLDMLAAGTGLVRLVVTWALVFLAFAAFAFAFKIGAVFSRGSIAAFFVLGLATTVSLRLAAAPVVRRLVAAGSVQGRCVVVVGDARQWSEAAGDAILAASGSAAVGRFLLSDDALDGAADPEPLREALARTVALVRERGADAVLIALPWSDEALVRLALDGVRSLPVSAYLVPDRGVSRLLRPPGTRYSSLCAIELQRPPLTEAEQALKRAFDLVAAGTALVALLPLLAAVAIVIKLDSRGPVLFWQLRTGFCGRSFRICKFRTMRTLDDGAEVRQATRDDPRVTAVGRWLRRSSLDELPQLINVLSGEMSLVGPRPHAVAHNTQYEALIASYAWRHHVKPGITGWAQVNGFRGETPTVDLMERRVEHDLWYVANWSFWLDLRTLALTVVALARRDGAF